jgi:uroporphyrinogen decarboxylase
MVVKDPLLIRAARGEKVDRAPAWMMRQAGRYQKVYRDLAKKYPSFRDRSETSDLIVEITLQPYFSFKPDGVILFSDILTPFPAFGIDFEIDDVKGPILERTILDFEGLKMMHDIDISKVDFVGQAINQLKHEVSPQTAVICFIGSPWTLSTYIVEGGSSVTYKTIKTMMFKNPNLLHKILSRVTAALTEYIKFQLISGAHSVQIFDSWGGQLPPPFWDKWSRPYVEAIINAIKLEFPKVPLTLYSNGSGGLLERMGKTGADIIGLDWSVDIGDARQRLGNKISVQGNVDPITLFASKESISETVIDTLIKAGPKGHILNLGHGVLVGTPEENVAHFFETNRKLNYASLFADKI